MVIGGDRTLDGVSCQSDGCAETFTITEVATPQADQLDAGSFTCGGRCKD